MKKWTVAKHVHVRTFSAYELASKEKDGSRTQAYDSWLNKRFKVNIPPRLA